jgi:replicative DNA helicase
MTSTSLPLDSDAEQHLLGSVWSGLTLGDSEARQVLWDVPPEAFFISEHRRLWAGMRTLVTDAKEPTELALAWVVYSGRPNPDQQAGVFEILQSGADYSPAPLAARVIEFAGRRLAVNAAQQVAMAATDYSLPAEEVTNRANAAFLSVSKGIGSTVSRFWSSDQMADTLAQGLGFRTGFSADKLCFFGVDWLDDLLLCTPGNVTVLGGRPGAVKTGLALQARNLTAIQGHEAGFFSLEMDAPEINARDAAWWLSDPSVNRVYAYKDMLKGHYDPGPVMAALRERLPFMGKAHSWHHSSGIPIGKLIAYIAEAVHSKGIRLAVVDYFQYIGLSREKGDSMASAYGANSMALKRCAQDLNIHILLLSQLNRGGEGRPGLSDLKETSQLEQDASGVPMLYRNKDNALCLTLPKNRDGETVHERDLDVAWPCLRIKAAIHETAAAGGGFF